MPGRTNKRFLAALLAYAACTGTPLPGVAQTVGGQATGGGQMAAPSHAGNQRMRAIVVPNRGIDPGMRIKPPSMPPQSTPVIRPPTTTSDGSAVVVPK